MSDDDFNMDDILGQQADEVSEDDALDAVFGDSKAFGTVDRERLPEDPFGLPDATYRFGITKVELKPTANNKNKFGLIVSTTIQAGEYKGRMTSEWLHYPNVDGDGNARDGSSPEQLTRSYANLNNHLKAYGLSDSQIEKFDHKNYRAMLMGNEFWATTKAVKDTKTDRTNIQMRDLVSLDQAGRGSSNDYDDPFGNIE